MISLERIQKKVEEVRSVFPWYGHLADHSRLRSIQQLPLMTSDLLERYYYNRMSDAGFKIYRTSGTRSNVRKEIYYSEEDDRRYIDLKVRLFSSFAGRQTGIRKAAADMGTGHAAGTALKIFAGMGMDACSIPFEQPIAEHVEQLRRFKPDLLYTMPSILDQIVLAADGPKAFGVKKIILVGEIASEQWIRRTAEKFGIRPTDILDTYGSIELGTMAYYSHEHGRYLIVEDLFAEGIQPPQLNEGIKELKEGESILVLTSFSRALFPALRYVTYDVVRDLRTLQIDGKEIQSFQSIVKRVGPELKHGEKISVYDIENIVYQYLDEARIRVVVDENKLVVYIQSKSLRKDDVFEIRQELQRKIPEIGSMIENGILDEIRVIAVSGEEQWGTGAVKHKKIHYEWNSERTAAVRWQAKRTERDGI
ncbi:CoF synthetase [Ferviditalea candida]|uniref:CoF synthetase n=1 Tax=Ferviditalea candida TaxID=3108399 RepID=A0ABU5ZGJ5_9BACL|nr:CoF synthetase [Paenibacillaceae bacterium T2]